MNIYPRETDELQPAPVTLDGVTIADGTGVTYALTTGATRPTVWLAPYIVAGKAGVRVFDLAPGLWKVWAKVTDSPEVPVIECGSFRVS